MGPEQAAILATVDDCPPPPSFRMRAVAMPDDLDFLLALYADSRAGEMAMLPWPEAQKLAFLAQQFTTQHTDYQNRFDGRRFWVVERKGKPIGRLYLAAPEGRLRIVDFSLGTRFQGRGWGTSLLCWLARAAQEAGVELELHVRQDNAPARRLYDRLGFRMEEVRGAYELMRLAPLVPS